MNLATGKLGYLARATAAYFLGVGRQCPNCGSDQHQLVDSKYGVTRLVRCANCDLQFRTPIDSESFSRKFYNLFYVEGDAMVCPSADEIGHLKSTNFVGTDRDFSHYIECLQRLGARKNWRVLDFGCSWGYGSYQFMRAGFDTWSYEIAEGRRNYGVENLGVRHIDDLAAIVPGSPLFESFDCFFSAHVIEHVPSPSRVFELAWQCLKPGGLFVAFTPNGCEEYRRNFPSEWSTMWGMVHPNFLDDRFYDRNFSRSERKFFACDGSDVMRQYELGFCAKKAGDAGF